MKIAGVRDVKNNLSRYVARGKSGEEKIITQRGKPIARIIKKNFTVPSLHLALAPLIKKGIVKMHEDIRQKIYVNDQDVKRLDFISDTNRIIFRYHYQQGLRSHVMELLDAGDVKQETEGVIENGLMLYPRANPLKILRIFKTKFDSFRQATREIERVKIIERYLLPDYMAKSQEFLGSYHVDGKWDILLCGLQEYVTGIRLDPWGFIERKHLETILSDMGVAPGDSSGKIPRQLARQLQKHTERFILKIRQMIKDTGRIPDLAGDGNLILTGDGNVKLVDINNVSNVCFKNEISVDDKDYPVCDASVQALALIEQKMLERTIDMNDPLYRIFLDPVRQREARAIMNTFYLKLKSAET